MSTLPYLIGSYEVTEVTHSMECEKCRTAAHVAKSKAVDRGRQSMSYTSGEHYALVEKILRWS